MTSCHPGVPDYPVVIPASGFGFCFSSCSRGVVQVLIPALPLCALSKSCKFNVSFEQLGECFFKQRQVEVLVYLYLAKFEEGCLLKTGPL